jgi:hypothetical protein
MGFCGGDFFEKAKPYIAMICLQFSYAGMNVITKVSLNHGRSHYVLVVYTPRFRHHLHRAIRPIPREV